MGVGGAAVNEHQAGRTRWAPGQVVDVDPAGADPVLVETTADYTSDLADLERKAATSGARRAFL